MSGGLLILQALLLVGWYAIPAMATVPWWVVLFPLLLVAGVWSVLIGFSALALVVGGLVAVFGK